MIRAIDDAPRLIERLAADDPESVGIAAGVSVM